MKMFSLQLNESVIKLSNVYDKIRKVPVDYDCGIPLFLSEIQVIEMIGNYPDANTTRLSEILGVTKGLVSRLTTKLEKKGFIEKHQYPDNKKEIYYRFTDLGKRAYAGHEAYHENNHQEIFERFENYDEEHKKIIINFLENYIDYLEEALSNTEQ